MKSETTHDALRRYVSESGWRNMDGERRRGNEKEILAEENMLGTKKIKKMCIPYLPLLHYRKWSEEVKERERDRAMQAEDAKRRKIRSARAYEDNIMYPSGYEAIRCDAMDVGMRQRTAKQKHKISSASLSSSCALRCQMLLLVSFVPWNIFRQHK